jgi:hypothetical protein
VALSRADHGLIVAWSMAAVGSWDSDVDAARATLRQGNSSGSSAACFACSWRCACHNSVAGGISFVSTTLGQHNGKDKARILRPLASRVP